MVLLTKDNLTAQNVAESMFGKDVTVDDRRSVAQRLIDLTGPDKGRIIASVAFDAANDTPKAVSPEGDQQFAIEPVTRALQGAKLLP